jgi:hypothetical protein
MKQLNDVVIFSLDKLYNPANDSQRAAIVSLFDAVPCLNMYQGQTEVSFLVDFKHFETAKAIARMFKQESILVVSDGARVVYLDSDNIEHIGNTLRQAKDVNGLDAWTMINGEYYAIS